MALKKLERILYVALTWPYDNRDHYERGEWVAVPAWVILVLIAGVIHMFARG